MMEYQFTDENGLDVYQDPDRPDLGDMVQTGKVDGLPYLEPIEE